MAPATPAAPAAGSRRTDERYRHVPHAGCRTGSGRACVWWVSAKFRSGCSSAISSTICSWPTPPRRAPVPAVFRASMPRRILLLTASALCLLYSLALIVSFGKNKALANDVIGRVPRHCRGACAQSGRSRISRLAQETRNVAAIARGAHQVQSTGRSLGLPLGPLHWRRSLSRRPQALLRPFPPHAPRPHTGDPGDTTAWVAEHARSNRRIHRAL